MKIISNAVSAPSGFTRYVGTFAVAEMIRKTTLATIAMTRRIVVLSRSAMLGLLAKSVPGQDDKVAR